ncbi:hypothetical protein [Methylobacter sp.]|uniref:hypothetical protein n=1 Tax=Methylobacter sp. TaxID=2051955 RepID=UPI001214AF04|nr:hypothetical protein [Methylobacter sp.]TAK59500.1 MAG: hypothetical protein EPO18_20270 [Methylobacter sp.]
MKLEAAEAEITEIMSKNRHRRVVAVDLDGTLAKYDGWKGFTNIGEPRMEMMTRLNQEHKAGSYIMIFTCRVTSPTNKVIPAVVKALEQYLEDWGIPYDEIWLGTGKPYANVYIDDKASRVGCAECIAHDEAVRSRG